MHLFIPKLYLIPKYTLNGSYLFGCCYTDICLFYIPYHNTCMEGKHDVRPQANHFVSKDVRRLSPDIVNQHN